MYPKIKFCCQKNIPWIDFISVTMYPRIDFGCQILFYSAKTCHSGFCQSIFFYHKIVCVPTLVRFGYLQKVNHMMYDVVT